MLSIDYERLNQNIENYINNINNNFSHNDIDNYIENDTDNNTDICRVNDTNINIIGDIYKDILHIYDKSENTSIGGKYHNILPRIKNSFNKFNYTIKSICKFTMILRDKVTILESRIEKLKKDYTKINAIKEEYQQKLIDTEESLDHIIESMPSENICSICMDNPRECVYLNCGHVFGCLDCCNSIGTKCPICRTDGNFMKIIYS